MVRTTDARSTKSILLPPTPLEIAKLAERARKIPIAESIKTSESVYHPFLSRRLTTEDRETIVARRKTGEKVKALCEEYGISESGMSDLMTRAKAPVRTEPITTEHIDTAVELYESGLTTRQVVNQIGYSIRTIRRALHQRGVTMRKSGKDRCR